jgi:hypothetical protein
MSQDYIASNDRMSGEWYIGKDVEGSVRGPILWYYPGKWNLEKLRKFSVRIACLTALIWTRDVPNTKQES